MRKGDDARTMRINGFLLSIAVVVSCCVYALFAQVSQPTIPQATKEGYDLPNGWRITPAAKSFIRTEDMVLKVIAAPDGRAIMALHSGFNPHGLVVVNPQTQEAAQRIPLTTAWFGMAWSPNGKILYVSGGNSVSRSGPERAPIYEFTYDKGHLNTQPSGRFDETSDAREIHWAGLAHHPKRRLLYAGNRGTGSAPTDVVVFDTDTRQIVTRIRAEVNPYELVFAADGRTLFVSNWASKSVSVIDTETNKVTGTIGVGINPNDMKLAGDGRLFVACSNDNTIYVIDTKKRRVIERLSTTLYPQAPEGSTPDALEIDLVRKLLYVANADNNSIAVVRIANPEHSTVLGFIPTGWYPSALVVADSGRHLYIGNSKGESGHANIRGPGSPLATSPEEKDSVKT